MYIDSTGAAAGRFALNAANADTATKLKNAITIQANGSSLGSYDGSAAKTFNITYANVGAAAADHIHTQYLTSHQSLAGYAKLSGATFTGAVKFNGVYGACINFDSAFYIDHQSGKTFLGTNGETAWVGMPAAALTFRGSATRPTYNGNEVALKSDISNTAHTHAVGKGLTMSGSGGTSGTVTYSANLKSTTSLGTIGTTGKLYAVGVDANGNLCVSVPWTDTNTTYTSLKNPYALTIQVNGTNKVVYDGSSAQTINFTPALLGAATSSHSHSYLPLSGGTLSGVLNCFGGGLKIGTSSESVSLTYDTSSDTLTITFP